MISWKAPNKIRFRKDEVIWILENYLMMKEGEYPPDPNDTGYIGEDKTGVPEHAHYEMACMIVAEVEARLTLCGYDGKLLYYHHAAGLDIVDLASLAKLDYDVVNRKVNCALYYITGWTRRQESYENFARNRRERYMAKVGHSQS